MREWADIITEFEDMAGRVRALAEERDDEGLRQLARRLSDCAADMRRDGPADYEVCHYL